MKIEKYLISNKYLLSLFGVSYFRDLQERLKGAQVGIDSKAMQKRLIISVSG